MLLKKLFTKIFYMNYRLMTFLQGNFWSKLFLTNIVFLVVLTLLSVWGANFLERIIDPLKYSTDTDAIIEIYPETNHERTLSKQEIVESYLRSNPNVINYYLVSKETLTEMLNTWSNVFNNLDDVAFPILLHVSLNPKTHYSPNDLQLALKQKVNNVYVSSEKQLASKLTATINISRNLILLIPVIVFAITFTMVLLTTIGIIYTQREAISVLAFLGAPYGEVAKEFAIWVFKLSIAGCLLGTLIAFLIVIGFMLYLKVGWFILPSPITLYLTLAGIVIIPIEATITTFFWIRKVIKWIV